MTFKQRAKIIGRVVSTLKIACEHLNGTNPYKVRTFCEGDTFFSLAFMSDKDLLTVDRITFN